MKTLKLLSLFILGIALIMGCTKDEDLLKNQDEIMLKKASKAPVFVVEPSGGDDTQALKEAFNSAIAAGHGSVVQLCEGEYHLGFIEIRDFYGCMKGKGKDKTIIIANSGLDAQLLMDQRQYPDLIKFVGGDVELDHFTIQTPEGGLTISGPPFIHSLINFSATNANYKWGNPNRSINVLVDNVRIKGQFCEGGYGYSHKYSSMVGLRTGWDYYFEDPYSNVGVVNREKVNFKIINSEVETFAYGIGLEGNKDGNYVIGEKNKGNVISYCDEGGGVWEYRNTNVLIEGNIINVFEKGWGFDLDNYSYYMILADETNDKASTFNVQHNTFNLNQSRYAMMLRDYLHFKNPKGAIVNFNVRNNKFQLSDNIAVVLLHVFTNGAVIRNNKFTGHSYSGGIYSWASDNGLLLGNNFSNAVFDAGWTVYLDNSNNWTIVGGNLGETVINNGENNHISGFNNSTSDIPFGQTIVDNLKEKKRPMYGLIKGN